MLPCAAEVCCTLRCLQDHKLDFWSNMHAAGTSSGGAPVHGPLHALVLLPGVAGLACMCEVFAALVGAGQSNCGKHEQALGATRARLLLSTGPHASSGAMDLALLWPGQRGKGLRTGTTQPTRAHHWCRRCASQRPWGHRPARPAPSWQPGEPHRWAQSWQACPQSAASRARFIAVSPRLLLHPQPQGLRSAVGEGHSKRASRWRYVNPTRVATTLGIKEDLEQARVRPEARCCWRVFILAAVGVYTATVHCPNSRSNALRDAVRT